MQTHHVTTTSREVGRQFQFYISGSNLDLARIAQAEYLAVQMDRASRRMEELRRDYGNPKHLGMQLYEIENEILWLQDRVEDMGNEFAELLVKALKGGV